MSTIPFTVIEGSMALPRLRPFGHVPAPFGRDWALLPPGYSLRAELKALYAAILRTFCMNDQTIRSLCRWSPLGERRATTAPAPVFEQPVSAAAQMVAAVPPVPPHAYTAASRGSGHHWSVLAGGACVLGGAAMLGWIGFDHLAHRQAAIHVDLASEVPDERDSQLPTHQAPAAVAARAVDKAAARTSAAVAASAPTLPGATASSPAAASVSINASTSARPLRFAPGRVGAEKTVSHRRQVVREKSARQREQIHPRAARFVAAKQPTHATAMAGDMPRDATSKVAANASPKPSAAGPYSPLAPSRLGVDEYAGVTMSAATHLRDIAPKPRTSSSSNASGSNGTEWMNHLSQRRVTDIPDQFAK
ncbi:hypothetical protein RI103_04625 [Paraburkholderia sp. FT54]|uniref:hypothetical protein n=1 Tax=Paraburkholderia sp. FT54 TaxID=3074437 RepID=UPI0028779578|nr:hypothetical protein [Paraburkholderia sp. FT54]WNC90651.1 hypothetical protein RI103_04625 [Paraburkholderia sp. FT54]